MTPTPHEADTSPEALRKLADSVASMAEDPLAVITNDDEAILKNVATTLRALADPPPAEPGRFVTGEAERARWKRQVNEAGLDVVGFSRDDLRRLLIDVGGLAKEVERLKDDATRFHREALGFSAECSKLKAKLASYEAPVADGDAERIASWITDGYMCEECGAHFIDNDGHPENGCSRPNWRRLTDEAASEMVEQGVRRLSATIVQRDAEITKLREALKPFADQADAADLTGPWADDVAIGGSRALPITVGEVRAARAALSPNAEEGKS